MPRRAEPDDIELELDHPGRPAQGRSARPLAPDVAPATITERRGRHGLIAIGALAVAAAVTATILASGPDGGGRRDDPTATPSTGASPSPSRATPTTGEAASGTVPAAAVVGPGLDDGRVAAVLGDKLVVLHPPAADSTLVGLITLDRTAPRPLWVSGRWIVAQGTGLDDPRTGTWAFDATGAAAPRFLGATTGFAPAVDEDGGLWLLGGRSVTRTTLDGTVTAGPFEPPAPAVAASGDGLVLDDAGRLSLWVPGTAPGEARSLGSGRVLDANKDQILWASPMGHIIVTTTRTLHAITVLRLDDTIVAGWLAPGGAHAGVATGTTIWVGPVRAALGDGWVSVDTPQPALAWASEQVALVVDGAGAVMSVRPRSGSTSEALQLPTAATAIAVIDDVEWRMPVVAEHPDAGEIRAYFPADDGDGVCFSRSVGRLEDNFVCWETDPTAAFQGHRTITGLLVGIARDPAITSVRIEMPTGPTFTVPVTAPGQPFPIGVLASPISDEPGPLRLVGLDRDGHEIAIAAA